MKICGLADLIPGSARAFAIGEQMEIIIIRTDHDLVAYANSCPHTGAPLNWLPDQFLDHSGTYIQCSNHDALFRIEDGVCIVGPCLGQPLRPVLVEVQAGEVILSDE